MKYIKKFEAEKRDDIMFSVGDIVVCTEKDDVSPVTPQFGRRYKVVRIYNKNKSYSRYKNVRRADLENLYVEVKDIETGEKIKDWLAYRYSPETAFNADKYNI